MSVAFELFCKPGLNKEQIDNLVMEISEKGGVLDYREASVESLCLTFAFSNRSVAERVAVNLRDMGQHVEGPFDY